MQKFKGVLFLSDIDGTLTDANGQISKENADAIRYFQSEGGLFTVASGRNPAYIERYAEQMIPNAPVIGINGTVIYDMQTKTHLWRCPLDADVDKVIVSTAKEFPEIKRVIVSPIQEDIHFPREDIDSMTDGIAALNHPLYRIVFVADPPYSHTIRDILASRYAGRYILDFSWSGGLELHDWGSSKGICIPVLCKILKQRGIDIHTTVAAGDYENDLTMMQTADISYAMENAIPAVKAAAKRHTVHHNESAIARIIEELDREFPKT